MMGKPVGIMPMGSMGVGTGTGVCTRRLPVPITNHSWSAKLATKICNAGAISKTFQNCAFGHQVMLFH